MPLSHLDHHDRTSLDLARRELDALYGESLRAVALTGEAAGAGYRPGRSPLELAVVLDVVTAAALRRVLPRLAGWARRRIAAPLFFDGAWLADSRDVFPIEFLALRAQHTLLHGAADPFAEIAVQHDHLLLEVEKQLRGKLLHLWEAYLETRGSRRRLRALLEAAPQGFAWILRGALSLSEEGKGALPALGDAARVFEQVERRFSVSIPALRRLDAMRARGERLPNAELEALFETMLGEVRALIRIGEGT